MDKPLISIIVPAYNIETYLPNCLESIISQTYQNIEIIVVDDGSTDNTASIIDEYAKKDARIIPLYKENGGVSTARFAGINISKGDLIGFVDGDDYIEPDMYSLLLDNLLKYNADISHCGYKRIFPNGREDLYYGTGRIIEQTRDQSLFDLLTGEFIEPGLWNKLFKKHLLNCIESTIWDPSIQINEDLLLNYILFSNSTKAIYEDITPYRYLSRRSSASTSKNRRNHVTDPIKVLKLILNDVQKNPNLYSVVYNRYIRTLILVATQNVWKNDANNAQKQLRIEIKCNDFNVTSLKVRLMALLTAYARPLYKLIRVIYDKITGVSKKYDID